LIGCSVVEIMLRAQKRQSRSEHVVSANPVS